MQQLSLRQRLHHFPQDCEAYFADCEKELRDKDWRLLHWMTLVYLAFLSGYLLVVCDLQRVPLQTRAVGLAVLAQLVYTILVFFYRSIPTPATCTRFLLVFAGLIMALTIFLGTFAFPDIPAVLFPLLVTLMTQVYTLPPRPALGLIGGSAVVFLALSLLLKPPGIFLVDLVDTLIAVAIATVAYLTLMEYKISAYQTHQELRQMCARDMMTGTLNKTTFIHCFHEALREGTASPPIALVIIDMDRFKQINDVYGHQVGDQVLCSFSTLLRKHWERQGDLVGRYGGDEFILLVSRTSVQSLQNLLMDFFNLTADTIGRQNHIPVSFSAGVTVAESEQFTFDQLFLQADQALYAAKEKRGNAVCIVEAGMPTAGAAPLMLVVGGSVADRIVLRSCFQATYRVAEAEDSRTAMELLGRYRNNLHVILLGSTLSVTDGAAVLDYLRQTPEMCTVPVLQFPDEQGELSPASDLKEVLTRPFLPEKTRAQVTQAIAG